MDKDLVRMKSLFQKLTDTSVTIEKDDVTNALCSTTGRVPYMNDDIIENLIDFFKNPPKKPKIPNFKSFLTFMPDHNFPFILGNGGLQMQRFKTFELLFDYYNRTDPIDFDTLTCPGGSGPNRKMKNDPSSRNPISGSDERKTRSNSKITSSGKEKRRIPVRTKGIKRDHDGDVKLN